MNFFGTSPSNQECRRVCLCHMATVCFVSLLRISITCRLPWPHSQELFYIYTSNINDIVHFTHKYSITSQYFSAPTYMCVYHNDGMIY